MSTAESTGSEFSPLSLEERLDADAIIEDARITNLYPVAEKLTGPHRRDTTFALTRWGYEDPIGAISLRDHTVISHHGELHFMNMGRLEIGEGNLHSGYLAVFDRLRETEGLGYIQGSVGNNFTRIALELAQLDLVNRDWAVEYTRNGMPTFLAEDIEEDLREGEVHIGHNFRRIYK